LTRVGSSRQSVPDSVPALATARSAEISHHHGRVRGWAQTHTPTIALGRCPRRPGLEATLLEGDSVAKIVVTAAVKDVEAWLKFKPQLIAHLSGVASDGTSYVAADGSNRVASTWDVRDMDAFQTAQTAVSPEMAAEMERYGMIPPVTVYIEK
jgi:hypothetical protein